ncbi:integral membrane protein [Teratosphaeria destructans]|uniref:Integral membrane protein n=1 Tax=Teratosphaeria destructans TaxID=418781 RepID=A0A9W7SSP9_9PEZI|nr:integral membrane protein [Teratosphaeria destructans]
MSSTNTTCDIHESASWLSWASPNSKGSVATSHRILLAVFCVLSACNGFEVIMMVFLTFKRYRGAYYWSLLLSGIGIVTMSVTTLLDSETQVGRRSRTNVYAMILAAVRLTGWCLMVTGQAFVLWSRLHLVLYGPLADKILRWTKWMILVDAVLLHVSTIAMAFIAESKKQSKAFNNGYAILLKFEVTWFFVQETILSSIYIWGATKMLRALLLVRETESFWNRNTVILKGLIAINVVIILMDLGLVLLQDLSQFGIQTLVKILIYAIKLKLEFAILRKLKKCVDSGGMLTGASSTVAPVPHGPEMNGSPFDLGGLLKGSTRSDLPQNTGRKDSAVGDSPHSHVTVPARACPIPSSTRRDIDYDLARFRHVENVRTLE